MMLTSNDKRANYCTASPPPAAEQRGVAAEPSWSAGARSALAGLCIGLLLLILALPSFGSGAATGRFSFVYPIVRPRISSTFGMRKHPIYKVRRHHKGLDLVAPIGTPIRAISEGIVVFADPYAGYGNLAVVRHVSGITTHYGHLQAIKVKIGETVRAGQIIGTLGSTGSSTGPHLHLEIRRDGRALDPLEVLPGLKAEAEG